MFVNFLLNDELRAACLDVWLLYARNVTAMLDVANSASARLALSIDDILHLLLSDKFHNSSRQYDDRVFR